MNSTFNTFETDETLDSLLMSLLQNPEDKDLLLVIQDYLIDIKHPAKDWWHFVLCIKENRPGYWLTSITSSKGYKKFYSSFCYHLDDLHAKMKKQKLL